MLVHRTKKLFVGSSCVGSDISNFNIKSIKRCLYEVKGYTWDISVVDNNFDASYFYAFPVEIGACGYTMTAVCLSIYGVFQYKTQ